MAAAGTGRGTAATLPGSSGHRRSGLPGDLSLLIALGLLALVPLAVGDSRTYMGLATTVVVYACYATGLNLIFGSTGQLFLCLGALAGVAGYTTTILSDRLGWAPVVAVALGTAAAALLGALFSWVSVRRSLGAIFTGIVTLTFSLAFGNLLLGQRQLTGGETGLVVAAGQGTALRQLGPGYYAFLTVLALCLAVFRGLQRSHHGWAFAALKEDPVSAELAGVDVAAYRIRAAAIGSGMVGLTGALHPLREGFLSPSTVAFATVDVEVLVILALGGIGSAVGPVVGAVALGLIDEVLRDLGQLRVAAHGAILVVLFLGFRQGIAPSVAVLARRAGQAGRVGLVGRSRGWYDSRVRRRRRRR